MIGCEELTSGCTELASGFKGEGEEAPTVSKGLANETKAG